MTAFNQFTFLKGIVADLFRLLYPHLCAGCGSDLPQQHQPLCIICMNQLPHTDFCMHADNPVEKIFWGRLPLVAASAHFYFTKGSLMQRLLHQFKYEGNTAIGEYFGKSIGASLLQSGRHGDIHGLIPLPLFYSRERKRGFNQAEILCRGIARVTGLPVMTQIIRRTAFSHTQTRKNREQRWKNMENKFQLTDRASLINKHALLVDDVITTGATLESCGSELLKIPGLRLSIAAMAYTSR